MIQVGGFETYGHDYRIPLKYGVDQCIGDTLGPGGIFRGRRHIPVMTAIARDSSFTRWHWTRWPPRSARPNKSATSQRVAEATPAARIACGIRYKPIDCPG
jgi:hypothetical protein